MGRIDGAVGGYKMDEAGAVSRNKTRADVGGGGVALDAYRDPSEVEYYNRKPPPAPTSYEAGGYKISDYHVDKATRNKDGTVTAGGVKLSADEYTAVRKQYVADQTRHREAYDRWWKEGWEKGYIGGSPNERGMPPRR